MQQRQDALIALEKAFRTSVHCCAAMPATEEVGGIFFATESATPRTGHRLGLMLGDEPARPGKLAVVVDPDLRARHGGRNLTGDALGMTVEDMACDADGVEQIGDQLCFWQVRGTVYEKHETPTGSRKFHELCG